MCGRYRIPKPSAIATALGVDTTTLVAHPLVATAGTVVPIVMVVKNQMVAEDAIFGYPRGEQFTVNARFETWQKLGFWQGSTPCVIPALGWVERGVWISGKEIQVLPFAGIMRDSHCAILTMNSGPGIREIHARQPVVIPTRGITDWLTRQAMSVYSDFRLWV